MPLTILVPALLRNLTGNQETIQLEEDGKSIAEILEKLDSRYPGFRSRICEENKELRRFINIYVDGEDIRFLNRLSTTVKDGAEISIVLAVAGG